MQKKVAKIQKSKIIDNLAKRLGKTVSKANKTISHKVIKRELSKHEAKKKQVKKEQKAKLAKVISKKTTTQKKVDKISKDAKKI